MTAPGSRHYHWLVVAGLAGAAALAACTAGDLNPQPLPPAESNPGSRDGGTGGSYDGAVPADNADAAAESPSDGGDAGDAGDAGDGGGPDAS